MTVPNSHRSRLAGGAYWAMMKRIVVVAGCIDAAWIGLYAALGAHALALLNVLSVAVYAAAFALIQRRRNAPAVALIWLEVLGHATLGTLLLGWDSGFHYFLLLFIPALVVGTEPRRAVPAVLVLLTVYAALWAASRTFGPLSPLPPLQLAIAHWVNVALVFAMFYGLAAYFRAQVIRAERQLLKMATIDPLTGLANRSQFHVRATAELARSRRERQPMALMLADVDFFKRINDEHGHDAGDQVLRRLAELMQQALRETDVLARWGGEEFLALLPASDAEQAAAVAERVREAVASVQIDVGGQRLQVTMSFGVTGLSPEQEPEADLQSATLRADRALYASKQLGRNRVTRAEALPGLPVPA